MMTHFQISQTQTHLIISTGVIYLNPSVMIQESS